MAWRFGIRGALSRGADGVFLFPGDLVANRTEENRLGWRQMLRRFLDELALHREVLVLGDYQSDDIFKTGFDASLTFPLIEAVWGTAMRSWLSHLGLSKLRTEVFVVS